MSAQARNDAQATRLWSESESLLEAAGFAA
jgi:hypothetical protein